MGLGPADAAMQEPRRAVSMCWGNPRAEAGRTSDDTGKDTLPVLGWPAGDCMGASQGCPSQLSSRAFFGTAAGRGFMQRAQAEGAGEGATAGEGAMAGDGAMPGAPPPCSTKAAQGPQ